MSVAAEDLDVLIVGAGISGIGAAHHLMERCPEKTFAILEGRAAIGGTWDLFRYPGIRSDSDMFTLGFPWSPWPGEQTVADGDRIRAYIEDTARAHGIDRKIRFGHRVERATWSSDAARWTVEAKRASDGASVLIRCRFLFLCTGYYDYEGGYTPSFPGVERFRGRIVHPQTWTDDVAYEGKRVVVIGSGATAIGIVPELAKRAAHVTMLQRSPTYMIAMPGVDPRKKWLDARLPRDLSYLVARTGNMTVAKLIYIACRRFPDRAAKLLIEGVRRRVGDGVDVDAHFTPRYRPWDQRLCLVRDGDLFRAIREGRADVVTDRIATFTERGIRTDSGRELEADLVVTATGLRMRLLGGIPLVVDGASVDLATRAMYKATMIEGVPNLATSLGYVNASWTLRSDMVAKFVCRLLSAMDDEGWRTCVPRVNGDDAVSTEAIFPLASGYVDRARHLLPRQGKRRPWDNPQSLARDKVRLEYAPIDDGALVMSR